MSDTHSSVRTCADNGGACHSSPKLSKTGLSAYLQRRLKEPPLKNGALSAKKLGFQPAAKPMNPETRRTSEAALTLEVVRPVWSSPSCGMIHSPSPSYSKGGSAAFADLET